RLLEEEEGGSHVVRLQVDFPECLEPSRRHLAEVKRGRPEPAEIQGGRGHRGGGGVEGGGRIGRAVGRAGAYEAATQAHGRDGSEASHLIATRLPRSPAPRRPIPLIRG